MPRMEREHVTSTALAARTARNTNIVPWNPRAGSKVPATALQNIESTWAGTVNVTVIRPCMLVGDLAKMKPRSIALINGNGRPTNELATSMTQ